MYYSLKQHCAISLCCFLSLKVSTVFAETNELGYEDSFIRIEAGLGAGYDSNLYDSFSDRASSYYYQPSLKAGMQLGNKVLGLSGNYNFDAFIPESEDDVAISNELMVEAYWSPSIRNTVTVTAVNNTIDEKRGSGLTEDSPFSVQNLDRNTRNIVEVQYSFINPRQESTLLTLAYGTNNNKYDSNRSVALNANLEQTNLLLDLGYQWSIHKKIYVEFNNIDQDYPDVDDSSQNSVNLISAIGLDWELTPAFGVLILVGEEKKKFNNSGELYNTDYWNIGVTWSPLSYTQFIFESRNQQEPLTEVNQTFNEIRTLSFNWKHYWSSQYSSLIKVSKEETHSVINDINDIEEELKISMSAYYRDFGFSVILEDENDNNRRFSQISVALTYTLKGGF